MVRLRAGEDATKSAYVARLDGLKALGDPIQLRYREHEDRPRATAALREVITGFHDKAASGDDKYSHIAAKDLETVIEACANAESWLGNKLYSQGEKPLDVKPVITSAEIKKKSEECVSPFLLFSNRGSSRALSQGLQHLLPHHHSPQAPRTQDGDPQGGRQED